MTIPGSVQDFISSAGMENTSGFIDKCRILFELLQQAGRKSNLTGIKDEKGYWTKHIADSISPLVHVPSVILNSHETADIGTGAGFPAIPLALALPHLKFTAIDSNRKKSDFAKFAAEKLSLTNLEPVWARAVELQNKEHFRNRYKLVVARAVGTCASVCRETRRMLSAEDGAGFLFYKTPGQVNMEIPAMTRLKDRSFTWTPSAIFELPENAGKRQFILGSRNYISGRIGLNI